MCRMTRTGASEPHQTSGLDAMTTTSPTADLIAPHQAYSAVQDLLEHLHTQQSQQQSQQFIEPSQLFLDSSEARPPSDDVQYEFENTRYTEDRFAEDYVSDAQGTSAEFRAAAMHGAHLRSDSAYGEYGGFPSETNTDMPLDMHFTDAYTEPLDLMPTQLTPEDTWVTNPIVRNSDSDFLLANNLPVPDDLNDPREYTHPRQMVSRGLPQGSPVRYQENVQKGAACLFKGTRTLSDPPTSKIKRSDERRNSSEPQQYDMGPLTAENGPAPSEPSLNESGLKNTMRSVKLTEFQKKFISDSAFRTATMQLSRSRIECPVQGCGMRFNKPGKLVFHYHSHAPEDRNDSLMCPDTQCPWHFISFKTNNILRRHVQSVHEHTREHKCPRCKRIFSRRDGLLRHQTKAGQHCRARAYYARSIKPESELGKLERSFKNIVAWQL